MTSKELTLLGEQLNHETQAYLKCKTYVSMLQDPVLKSCVQQIACNHKQRFETLNNYLNTH